VIPDRWPRILGRVDVDGFIRDGYVVIRGAVDAATVVACRERIWESMKGRGVHQDDPATWPPLVQIEDLQGGPFVMAGMAPALTAACDELIGPGRWDSPVRPGAALMVRFPSEDRANAGYHIEASYRGPDGRDGWVNIRSRARGLLAHATGAAGDVFLCHPFIVHTATWPHRGTGPRMIAQPMVSAADGFAVDGTDPSPVARAIVAGLAMVELHGKACPASSGAGCWSPERRGS
jgi:hypothetical protein